MSKNSNLKRAVFIDRDGTMNVDVGYVSSPDQLEVYPWTGQAVRLINESGLLAIVVSNQSGVARGFCSEQTLELIHERLMLHLEQDGARLDALYYCPHHPEIGDAPYRRRCDCRKPQPGMLHRAATLHDIDLARSFVIGDKASDIALAKNARARSVLVLTGYGQETLANPDVWPCEPDAVCDNLLEAVNYIVSSEF
ncbi:MAG TPA: HAD family hydrolase [Blastocatellia bacterium]|nr:HAD family hydrolase [Blastocatellia bacterium]